MKKLVSANSLLALALCLSGTAALGQHAQPPLANDDVVQMVVNGLPQSIVIGAISANNVNFDVSTSGLLSIRKAGVGDEVIEAMLAAQTKNREAAALRGAIAAQQPGPAQLQAAYLPAELRGVMGMHAFDGRNSPVATEMPKVTLVVGDKKQPMQPSTTEIANAKGQGGSTAGGILKGFGKGALMVGSMTGAPVPHGGRVALPSQALLIRGRCPVEPRHSRFPRLLPSLKSNSRTFQAWILTPTRPCWSSLSRPKTTGA